MASVNLRRSVRAVILDETDRVLLCRLDIPGPDPIVVWVAPGGGIEAGESAVDALRRELREEIGLNLDTDPVHVWHQEVAGPDIASGYDGIVNDYFLIRTRAFAPRGSFTDERLAAEYVTRFGWWTLSDVTEYDGSELFSPRDLATPLTELIAHGPPDAPVSLGV